jgi:hypothetical protein
MLLMAANHCCNVILTPVMRRQPQQLLRTSLASPVSPGSCFSSRFARMVSSFHSRIADDWLTRLASSCKQRQQAGVRQGGCCYLCCKWLQQY